MIRLQRTGRRNNPSFRVALAEKRSKPKSGALELLGSFDPKTKQSILKKDRILYWLSQGAHPSATAHNLLISQGVTQGKKIAVKMAKPKTSEVKPETAKVENTKQVTSSATTETLAA